MLDFASVYFYVVLKDNHWQKFSWRNRIQTLKPQILIVPEMSTFFFFQQHTSWEGKPVLTIRLQEGKKTKKRKQENTRRIREGKEWEQEELRGERKRGFRNLKKR